MFMSWKSHSWAEEIWRECTKTKITSAWKLCAWVSTWYRFHLISRSPINWIECYAKSNSIFNGKNTQLKCTWNSDTMMADRSPRFAIISAPISVSIVRIRLFITILFAFIIIKWNDWFAKCQYNTVLPSIHDDKLRYWRQRTAATAITWLVNSFHLICYFVCCIPQ